MFAGLDLPVTFQGQMLLHIILIIASPCNALCIVMEHIPFAHVITALVEPSTPQPTRHHSTLLLVPLNHVQITVTELMGCVIAMLAIVER